MKNRLPIVLFAIGLVVVIGVFLKIRGSRSQSVETEDGVVADIPLEKRPFVSLTPKSDGHWVTLKIENQNKVDNAVTLDYEFLYETMDGTPQGSSGDNIALDKAIEREILLGSESSGKYRYDEGVEKGTLTIRYRNDLGKVVGKLSTDFRMQSNATELSTIDGKFAFTLERAQKAYFITMNTFGLPGRSVEFAEGPFGIFSSDNTKYSGDVKTEGSFKLWSGSNWTEVSGKTNIGVFVKS